MKKNKKTNPVIIVKAQAPKGTSALISISPTVESNQITDAGNIHAALESALPAGTVTKLTNKLLQSTGKPGYIPDPPEPLPALVGWGPADFIDVFQRILDEHRAETVVSCPENCICWKIDGAISTLEILTIPDPEEAIPGLAGYIESMIQKQEQEPPESDETQSTE